MSYECTECGGSIGDFPPCGCAREQRARIEDDERFEPVSTGVSFTSQQLIKTDAEAEMALRGVIDSTREERIDALRFGPQMRRTMAFHIIAKRCEDLSARESRIERREVA